ncbi:pyridoxal phosphate-dependent aminotransferase [Dictyobacter aurantiacus]|uniref:Aminotransferase class I/classII large domain-containing protein n=1 Tax=Dictyobacter aurantiacus TaxID=1936993 RepID=A0A401ZDC8_9CHLR|nr:pyridoxal phosphate-dependent aminotransferase [Dictyobacter aurantiacus]GCE04855.1 hypothetical protein KDAU_21840 [Dictyobacter aurantiacus]
MSQYTSAINSSDSSVPSRLSDSEQRTLLRQLRSEIIERYRPHIREGAGPIRVMARIVAELEQTCRQHNIDDQIIRAEVVNRTIGDIDLRQAVECEGEEGGPEDYRILADELGIALPGEELYHYTATGETYYWLRDQMLECERLLLSQGFDPRVYDIYGIGNPVLRGWLAQEMGRWGIEVTHHNVHLSLGAMDGIDNVLRGVAHIYRTRQVEQVGILFPEPGFGVPEWQALSYGYQIHRYKTSAEHRFKLTGAQLEQILAENPDIHVLYLTITNNPTAFAYSPAELEELHAVLASFHAKGREILTLADLAYIGTGKPEEDQARMATFIKPEVLQHTIFVSSFSKTHTLTGERFGWVTCGDPNIAAGIAVSWSNGLAALPGEWQLRFMAYYRLLQTRPWLGEKLRRFYRLRRTQLVKQLQEINEEFHLFQQIYIDDDATVYNWSRLNEGIDAFALFEKTGIAGVPGSGFGYDDEYIRFSIGVIPIIPGDL